MNLYDRLLLEEDRPRPGRVRIRRPPPPKPVRVRPRKRQSPPLPVRAKPKRPDRPPPPRRPEIRTLELTKPPQVKATPRPQVKATPKKKPGVVPALARGFLALSAPDAPQKADAAFTKGLERAKAGLQKKAAETKTGLAKAGQKISSAMKSTAAAPGRAARATERGLTYAGSDEFRKRADKRVGDWLRKVGGVEDSVSIPRTLLVLEDLYGPDWPLRLGLDEATWGEVAKSWAVPAVAGLAAMGGHFFGEKPKAPKGPGAQRPAIVRKAEPQPKVKMMVRKAAPAKKQTGGLAALLKTPAPKATTHAVSKRAGAQGLTSKKARSPLSRDVDRLRQLQIKHSPGGASKTKKPAKKPANTFHGATYSVF